MTATADEYDAAVRAFWTGRSLQQQKQIDAGRLDAGTRGAVTGGAHLDPIQVLLAKQFDPLKSLGAAVRHSGKLPLPGYYRRAKNWDIVVTYGDILVAAIECKSQSGSFGNNFNNRTEEALGNAVDLWRGYQDGHLGPIRPWVGFLLILERAPASTNPVKDSPEPLYRADPAFDNSSYTQRYRLLLQRLNKEKLYDATCLISTVKDEGIWGEPDIDVSTANFTAAIAARVTYIQELAANSPGYQSGHPRTVIQHGTDTAS